MSSKLKFIAPSLVQAVTPRNLTEVSEELKRTEADLATAHSFEAVAKQVRDSRPMSEDALAFYHRATEASAKHSFRAHTLRDMLAQGAMQSA